MVDPNKNVVRLIIKQKILLRIQKIYRQNQAEPKQQYFNSRALLTR